MSLSCLNWLNICPYSSLMFVDFVKYLIDCSDYYSTGNVSETV